MEGFVGVGRSKGHAALQQVSLGSAPPDDSMEGFVGVRRSKGHAALHQVGLGYVK